jgi:hypothetical protein
LLQSSEFNRSGQNRHAACARAVRRCAGERRNTGAASGSAHDLPRARRRRNCRSHAARRRGLARRSRRDDHRRKRRRDLLALRARGAACASRGRRHLTRGDSVAFPPGGCAYRHTHQGPGIRCLLEGGIRIDTAGRSTSYGPGGAWYESGPEPVFAQAADRPSRFTRVMILPRALLGKSSLQLVDPADAGKPRAQQYQIFADAPIARPPG